MTTKTCDNPLCACDPCGCESNCPCGAANLGELERQVMDVLWDAPGHDLSGRQVADALGDYAYTTVATILDRLEHKGLVIRTSVGRPIRFSAVGTRGAHAAVLMHKSLGATHDPEGALVRFVETLSESETEILRRTLKSTE